MKRAVLMLVALALLLGGVRQAQAGLVPPGGFIGDGGGGGGGGADPLFVFTFSGGGVSGSAQLNAVSNGDGSFTAISGTGSVSGAPDSGALTLVPNPNAPNPASTGIFPDGVFFTYDNQLFPGQDPLVNNNGLLFSLPDGTNINIFSNGPGSYTYFDSTLFNTAVSVSLTTAAPEPSSLTLLGLGIAGMAGYGWRRRRQR